MGIDVNSYATIPIMISKYFILHIAQYIIEYLPISPKNTVCVNYQKCNIVFISKRNRFFIICLDGTKPR